MVPDNEIVVFKVDLNELFEIIIAANYLEVESLLNESCRYVLINNKWEIIQDNVSNFHDPNVTTILEKYEREFGYDVIVTIVENNKLIYFETKVIF